MIHTKEAIVETFLQMLEERPYSKITVRSLVERCGINRNTFYYYFDSIPALMETTGREWIRQVLQEEDPDLDEPLGVLTRLAGYCTAHRRAIGNVYRSASREAVLASLDELSLYLVEQYIDRALIRTGIQIGEGDRKILCRFYKCALVGLMLDWMDAKMSYDLVAAFTRACELLGGTTRQAFLRSADGPAPPAGSGPS